jgi:hypothetical protein
MMQVNFVAVAVAAIASMAVGFGWYNPMFFGKAWMKQMGYTEADLKAEQKKMGKLYGLSLIGAVVMAYVLSHVMKLSMGVYGYTPIMTGVTTGFWMWLGFVAPVQMTDAIFGSKNWKLFKINTGYQLASLIVMGVVLGFMG